MEHYPPSPGAGALMVLEAKVVRALFFLAREQRLFTPSLLEFALCKPDLRR